MEGLERKMGGREESRRERKGREGMGRDRKQERKYIQEDRPNKMVRRRTGGNGKQGKEEGRKG